MPILTLNDSAREATVQFVDRISDDATVRLDLMDGPFSVQSQSDFSPPTLRRKFTSNMLADGGELTASAFDLRTLRIVLQVSSISDVDFAANLRDLYAELVRPRNVLRLQVGDRPVYFRTHAAPDAALRILGAGIDVSEHLIEIPADPFGYGEKQTLPDIVISPSAPVHTIPADSIKGDVAAPLLISRDVAANRVQTFWLSSRVGALAIKPLVDSGAGDGYPLDNGITDPDSIGGSRAAYGGLDAAGDFALVSFKIPLRAGQDRADLAGAYRCFAFLYDNGAAQSADRWKVELNTEYQSYNLNGIGAGYLPLGTPAVYNSGRLIVDLGLVTFPFASATQTAGFDDPISLADLLLTLRLTRLHTTGSNELNVDALWFLPVDDTTLSFTQATPDNEARTFAIDPVSGGVLSTRTQDGQRVPDQTQATYLGRPPEVHPGQDLCLTGFTGGESLGSSLVYDTAQVGLTLHAAYWPRYLSVA